MNIWMIGENSMKHYLKKNIFTNLNIEVITDADYAQEKRVCKDFETKNLGEYQNLYVQSDKLLFVDVFNNFQNMGLDKCEIDLARFLPHQV